ncbi:CoA transferase [Pantoea phytobeneficialis]|uniref:CoA transferase n=1 Tax=Pantoea phytobeneficialis TaxID=2052056 RepID=A0AAP9KNY7_9GAMM|nr:CoA transferase [Pantoea phytobeneficialis]MDO6408043.1 CoA transferase [Pantoea phytobeneficialis]QGR06415.1 acyl-CoA transferase [Pantoea phytobeneficialis]
MDYQLAAALWQHMWQGLRGTADTPPPLTFSQADTFPSAYAVSELAATSIGLATQAVSDLLGRSAPVSVNVRLASRWFQHSFIPLNRPPAALWDPFAGDYATRDGWIRLHTNASHHRQAMEKVLGVHRDRTALATEVLNWSAAALEQAVVDAGGCAAQMRSVEQWQQHAQGIAVGQEPLFAQQATASGEIPDWPLSAARPLRGIRVLDLTRIIAGPVATRFLASLGAEVLRIDPPDWQEPSLEEEITSGKRCARLDLKSVVGLDQLRTLLSQADVLVHGYRADALENLGLDAATRQQLAPALVDVSLNAWGWRGPWRNRRGFDSLVQMACGIAHQGMQWSGSTKPTPLPVQALDHATGYMLAAAVLEGLRQRRLNGTGWQARLSLARTALLLQQHGFAPSGTQNGITPQPDDVLPTLEITHWGIGERLRAASYLPGTPQLCATPGVPLGSSAARW